jgi:cell division protein FtsB
MRGGRPLPAADRAPVESRRRRRLPRPRASTLFAFTMVGYFGYHMVDGDRGLLAWQQLEVELRASRAERARVRSERERLEHRVVHLRRTSLNPDLLDERARASLSLIGPHDVIILLEDESDPD